MLSVAVGREMEVAVGREMEVKVRGMLWAQLSAPRSELLAVWLPVVVYLLVAFPWPPALGLLLWKAWLFCGLPP